MTQLMGAADYVHCPSGLILPTRAAEERYRPKQRPRCVDLFAGCGGFSLGVIQAGVEVVAAVEFEFAAAVTYMVNLCRYGEFTLHFDTPQRKADFNGWLEKDAARARKAKKARPLDLGLGWVAGSGWISKQPRSVPGVSHFFIWDASKLAGSEILSRIGMEVGELDMVVGGPPCQGFSMAGNREVTDPRNNLVFEFCRLITEMRPRTLCMENVPGILDQTDKHGRDMMAMIARILESGGYAGHEAMARALELQGIKLHRGDVAKGAGVAKAKRAPEDEVDGIPDLFGDL